MTTPDWLTALAEKAAQANKGPWYFERDDLGQPNVLGSNHDLIIAECPSEFAEPDDDAHRDAAYLAACTPEAIVALVEVAKAARDVSCCGGCWMEGDACRKPLDAAMARLDACAAGRIA